MSWQRIIAARRPDALNGVCVLKSAAAPMAAPVNATKPHVDLGKMCVTAVLTTRTADRQGDIVDPEGGDFSEHMTNPVVMFHHGKDHRLPIGKAEDPNGNYTVRFYKAKDGDLLLGTTYFAQSNRFANDVFGLVAEDILRGVSIGFDPAATEDAVSELGQSPILDRPALHFKSWKLLEYSHTPIGVNRDALTVAVQKSLDGSRKLHPLLEKYLTPFATPRRVTVTSGGAIEKGTTALMSPKVRREPKQDVWSARLPNPTLKDKFDAGKDRKIKPGSAPKTPTPTPGVTKAMPDDDYTDDTGMGQPDDDAAAQMPPDADPSAGGGDGYDPTTDDPNDDPSLPAGVGAAPDQEAPPTVQALLDGSQGLMDLCSQLEAGLQKGEHPTGRKFGAKMCAKLRALAAQFQQQAESIHSEINGPIPGEGGDSADDAEAEPGPDDEAMQGDSGEPDGDENAEQDAAEPEEPPTDEDGAVVTKGLSYAPRRFAFAGTQIRIQTPTAAPQNTKALRQLQAERDAIEAERDELKAALENVLSDVEAGARRTR